MANIPYTPFATVTPQGATPRVGVSAPGAAFGENVGKAVEGFGGTMEKVGNELFTRAVALQQLRNETEANEAVTKYEMAGGSKLEEFRTQQGKDASDGLKPFQSNIDDLRNQIREGLSNDSSRRMYDTASRSFQARMIMSSAGHAAQENKRYIVDTAQYGADAANQSALTNPTPEQFEEALRKNIDAANHIADIKGYGENDVNRTGLVFKQQSLTRTKYLEGRLKEDATGTKDQMNKWWAQNLIHYDDYMPLKDKVNRQVETVVARDRSDMTNSGLPAGFTIANKDALSHAQPPARDVAAGALIDLEGQGIRAIPDPEGGGRIKGISDGRSVVLVPLGPNGKPDRTDSEAYAKMDAAIAAASTKRGVPLEKTGTGVYSLPKDYDLSKAPPPVPETLQSRISRGVDSVKGLYPDIPGLVDAVRNKTIQDYSRHKAVVQEQKGQDNDTIVGGIAAVKATPGGWQAAKTIDALRIQDRALGEAYDRAGRAAQVRYDAMLARPPVKFTDPKVKQDLTDMMINEPERFLETDFSKIEGLSDTDLNRFAKQKSTMLSKPDESNTRVREAMTNFGHQARFKDIFEDSDMRGRFTLALSQEMNQYFHDNHKTMPPEMIQKTGENLIQSTSSFFDLFRAPEQKGHGRVIEMVPTGAELKALMAKGNISQQGALNLFRAQKYQELYGKTE